MNQGLNHAYKYTDVRILEIHEDDVGLWRHHDEMTTINPSGKVRENKKRGKKGIAKFHPFHTIV